MIVELPDIRIFPDGCKEKSYPDAGAVYSPCENYRYSLWRIWGEGDFLAVIGLNPSTATESVLDPTIRRCVQFAKDWGFGGLFMLNIFAWRATDPRDMRAADDPIGPANDEYLRTVSVECAKVLAAWGSHGQFVERSEQVKQILNQRLDCLGTTKTGQPRHPLYVPGNRKPELWWSPEL